MIWYVTLTRSLPSLLLLLLTEGGVGVVEDVRRRDDGWMNFQDLYLYGKDAYLANDWKDCVYYFEKAVDDYKSYNDKVLLYCVAAAATTTTY